MTMTDEALSLLKSLIATPSLSRQEEGTADILEAFLRDRGVDVRRHLNNVWAKSYNFDSSKPTLLLCSHHDTVKPSPAYTFGPFTPTVADGRLYGLGSNDAGASAVALALTFCKYRDTAALPFNLVLALVAEEEVSGVNGVRALLSEWKTDGLNIDMGIVGEPTGMQAAIAERGLVVLDGVAKGPGGHAARHEGECALYTAVDDVTALRRYRFPATSPTLGDIKVTVTQIEAGRQHNVVPEECRFVVDVRTTDTFTNEEVVELLRQQVKSELTPRSTRIRASVIGRSHPLVRAAEAIGASCFVSPTTSDMSAMHEFPTLKIGIGDSSRSHTPDEYIELAELRSGLESYDQLIQQLINILK